MPYTPTVLPFTLRITWSMPKNYGANIIKQQQSGIIERGAANQINLVSHTYQIKSFVRSYSEYETINNYFDGLAGKPFIFNGAIYSCPEHRWTCEWNLWIFEATFNQVYK
jgi:hypothetical protein